MLKRIPLKDHLHDAYDESLVSDKIQLAQVCALAGIIAFVTTVFMEKFGFFPALTDTHTIRYLVICVLAICLAATLRKVFFIKYYTPILISTFLFVSFLIEYAIYLSIPFELAYYTYFSSLIILIMALYSWTYLSFRHLFLSTLVILTGYVLAIWFNNEQSLNDQNTMFLMVTMIKLLGAIFISVIGKFIRDQQLHKKFMLQQSFKEMFEEKVKESDKHKHHASHDTLTNLPNRRYVEDHLMRRLSNIQEHKKIMVVMFLDLNGFKKINDDFGHEAGDFVLKVTANRLVPFLSEHDSLVRLGGDEFIMCFTIDDDDDAQRIIENILEKIKLTIAEAIMFESFRLGITSSIGVATSVNDGYDINRLISIADKRMYEDKVMYEEEVIPALELQLKA